MLMPAWSRGTRAGYKRCLIARDYASVKTWSSRISSEYLMEWYKTLSLASQAIEVKGRNPIIVSLKSMLLLSHLPHDSAVPEASKQCDATGPHLAPHFLHAVRLHPGVNGTSDCHPAPVPPQLSSYRAADSPLSFSSCTLPWCMP